ncbi:MAG: ComEA family DNA-binding protein [Candidatus Levybacteria bacterium]|nr:ComEA family DNA-binding protein [Candidatus Levybacteria bacterium]
MNTEDFLQKYSPLLKRHWLPLLLGAFGLIFLGYGLISLIGSSNGSEDIVFESGENASSSAKLQSQEITVDVEGAVVKPGVYTLKEDARIQDALIASGGLSGQADRNWVAAKINLAQKIKDGAKIYIPLIGQSQDKTNLFAGTGEMQGNIENSIDINSASQQELDSLPGVGVVTAQKIINGRPYDTIDDLLNKKIVGSKVFEQIKDKIAAN